MYMDANIGCEDNDYFGTEKAQKKYERLLGLGSGDHLSSGELWFPLRYRRAQGSVQYLWQNFMLKVEDEGGEIDDQGVNGINVLGTGKSIWSKFIQV